MSKIELTTQVKGKLPAANIADTAVTPGGYTSANITVDAQGRVTSAANGGGGISDGDKGDITVSSSGTVWAIDAGVVTLAKIANAAASSKLLGSGASGAGASYAEITLGSGLTMTGTTLSASGGGSGTVTTTGSPASGNLTKFSGATSITNGDLTGDVTTSGTLATTLANSGVTAGSYINANITVDAKGRVTAASGSGGSLTTPTDSLFSITLNSVTATDAVSFNGVSTYKLSGAASGASIRARLRTLPGGNFTVIVRLEGFSFRAAFNGAGIVFRDTGGKYAFGGWQRPDLATISALAESWTNSTTFSSTNASVDYDDASPLPQWIKAAFDSSTNDIVWSHSWDKTNWTTTATNTFLGTADAVGLCVKCSNASVADTAWFSDWELF